MEEKQSKIRKMLLNNDSSSQSQFQHLNPHQQEDLLTGRPATQDFNSNLDAQYEYEGNSYQEERNRPLPAVEEYDQQRQKFRSAFKLYCQNRKLIMEEEYSSHRSSKGKKNRTSFSKSSHHRSKDDRDSEEMMDARKFKKITFPEFVDVKKQSEQHRERIENVDIYFPFKPYPIQQKYIQKVIEALDTGANALLESPTGTGKTLCLLSGILSWIAKEKMHDTHRRVVYLSRTHSQLFQVVKQLKNTCFRPTMVHVGSRDYACIKSELRELKGRQKMEACSKGVAIRKKYCRHEYNFEKMTKQEQAELRKTMCNYYEPDRGFMIDWGKNNYANKVMDLEEMKNEGSQYGFCPYFYPLYMEQYVDLFLMPYNYILDIDLLPRYGNMLSGSIVVFDQAHNVPEAACEGRSAEMFMANLKGAEVELTKIIFGGKKSTQLSQIGKTHNKLINELLSYLKDMQGTFTQYLNSIPFDDSPLENEKLYKGEKENTHIKVISAKDTSRTIYQLFAGKLANPQEFTTDTAQKMKSKLYVQSVNTWNMIETLIEALKETEDGIFHNLEKVAVFAKKAQELMMSAKEGGENWFETEINHFRLMLQAQPSQTKIGSYDDFKLELRCLVPWLTFDQIQQYSPRSIIFTSGTMSPLDSWEVDLKIKAPVRLVNSHVISEDQIRLNIVKKSIRDNPFNFGHQALKNTYQTIYNELMLTLIAIEKRIPNGILVVCPNFKTLYQLKKLVTKPFIRQKFVKALIFEERGNENYVDEFKEKSQKGAILVCVCRGRASEGIDFPDHHCRAVVMVGVPYPNVKDPYLIQKQDHFKKLEREAKFNPEIPKINWNQWYLNGTIRAVNQALGRVVRHIKDYGMLFLFDERYEQSRLLSKMPKWAKDSLQIWHQWQDRRVFSVDEFYRSNKLLFPLQNQSAVDMENEDTTLLVGGFQRKEQRRVFITEKKSEENRMKEFKQKVSFTSKPPKGFVGQTTLFDFMKKK